MTKEEAVRIAGNHLFAFVDSADFWEDPDYQDYVEALRTLGYKRKNK
jgi:hypothetical protein